MRQQLERRHWVRLDLLDMLIQHAHAECCIAIARQRDASCEFLPGAIAVHLPSVQRAPTNRNLPLAHVPRLHVSGERDLTAERAVISLEDVNKGWSRPVGFDACFAVAARDHITDHDIFQLYPSGIIDQPRLIRDVQRDGLAFGGRLAEAFDLGKRESVIPRAEVHARNRAPASS